MDIHQARDLAISLMQQHGIWNEGWRFRFDNARRRFGFCKYRSKEIGLSHILVKMNDQPEVLDTILHEIAHAKAYAKHGKEGRGHGWQWKAEARSIGARPERCYDKSVPTPQLRFQATCTRCGHKHERSRRPTRISSCGHCSRSFDSTNLLLWTDTVTGKSYTSIGKHDSLL